MAGVLLLGVAVTLLVLWALRKYRQSLALKEFGGHWTTRWTRLWLLRAHSSGRMNHIFTEMNDKYGGSEYLCAVSLINQVDASTMPWPTMHRYLHYNTALFHIKPIADMNQARP